MVHDNFITIANVLQNDETVKNYIGDKIFFGVKPESAAKVNNYITLNYSEADGGNYLRLYDFSVTVITEKFASTACVKDRIIELLDKFYGEFGIKADKGNSIRSIQLRNGNDIVFNTEDENYYSFLYFDVIL